jgi:fumarate reductase subunit D
VLITLAIAQGMALTLAAALVRVGPSYQKLSRQRSAISWTLLGLAVATTLWAIWLVTR